MTFDPLGVPEKTTPRVGDAHEPHSLVPKYKSPKSFAFPVDAIVTKSIRLLLLLGLPV